MNNSEFDIIKKYFTFAGSRDDVLIAGGDDCASVIVPDGKQLLITVDTLISGVHFPLDTSPEDIAYKAVMVNLSDLAAMGAVPAWLTLAITLPQTDHGWLQAFSKTLSDLLDRYGIALIGGDTTRGDLSITIQAMGLADQNRILRRNAAAVGDKIYVTGVIGDAAIGLRACLDQLDDERLNSCINKLNRPEARVEFAQALPAFCACAIDISDGLLADLGHIIKASNCGAKLYLPAIPVSQAAHYYFDRYLQHGLDWSMLLTQGDDYELCFTVDPKQQPAVNELADAHRLSITCIGEITASEELLCIDDKGKTVKFSENGFQHF